MSMTRGKSVQVRRVRDYRKLAMRLLSDIVKIAVVLLFVFPFFWMFSTAFKPYIEAIQTPPSLWPQNFTTEAFTNIAEMGIDITQYAKNSVIVTVAVIVLQLVIMIPAAYAFARRDFPFSNLAFGMVLVAFMVPGQLTYITVYLMMAKWGLINSLWPQILPLGANAFGIFMMRQSFKQIPEEIVEAARLDNANELQIMMKIMLPMCKSSLFTVAMFSFIDVWNAYFWPLVMTNNEAYRPLTMVVERIRDAEMGLQWNTIMAANCILVVPVIIIFIFFSKKIIEGFTYRGVK